MSNAELIECSAAEWLARRDGGDRGGQQQQQFEAWLAVSLAHRIAYLRLSSAWQRADRLGALRPAAASEAIEPAPALPAAATRHRWPMRSPMQQIAASLAVAVMLGGAWFGWHGVQPGSDPSVEAYSTAIGSHESLTLADGSRLMLNTDTRLRTAVGAATRTVWLDKGEAYFDIAHDASRPFVVLAGDRRITVLGVAVRDTGDEIRLSP
jgi:transmembrane sensor